MTGTGRMLCVVVALFAIACQSHVDKTPPTTTPPTTTPPPVAKGTADGGKCSVASDCQSGVCEGQGCGDVPGVCMSKDRVCTTDARQYCGCDGKTFTDSGSCPGRRFKARGACEPTSSEKVADGGACTVGGDCSSGICEGMGCGDNKGVCAAKGRACTRDFRQYCGCDGKTFGGSGSCPGRRYSARAPCK